jgi:hypothetical protein
LAYLVHHFLSSGLLTPGGDVRAATLGLCFSWGLSTCADHVLLGRPVSAIAQDLSSEDPELNLILVYAESIGLLTIYWAALENALSHTIEKLLRTDEMTANCVTTSLDKAAGRALLIQRLALRPGEAPSELWRDTVVGLCDRVMNKWAPQRNRLIHDEWTVSGAAIQRHNPAIKIGRPGSRQAKTLLRTPPGPSHGPEITSLTRAVVDAMVHFVMLGNQYLLWKQTGRVPEVPQHAIRASKGLPQGDPEDAGG